MSLWDDMPSSLKSGGQLDSLEPVLDSVDTPVETERTEDDGFTWRIWTTTVGGDQPLSVDPATGSFSRSPSAAISTGTPVVFPDPRVGLELGLRLTGPGGDPDGTVRLVIDTPSAFVRVPFLRGAKLDAQGQLRADPDNPDVRFTLPAIRVRLLRPSGGGMEVDLLSSTIGGGPPRDQIFDFIRMEPRHALIGPGEVVGFAFRSATLDLTGEAGPAGVPANARTQPDDWQGLYLPEVRLFVAPSGLEGLAASAGVRDLWIGIGRHAGVTGLFEAEVVNRGQSPTVRLSFQGPAGEWYSVQDGDPVLSPVELPDSATLYISAGGGLAPYAYRVQVNGDDPTTLDRRTILLPATGTMTLDVRVTDAGLHEYTRTVTVRRATSAGGGAPTPPEPKEVKPRTLTSTGHRVVVLGQTDTHATVALSPGDDGGTIAWSWPGGSATGPTAQIPVAAGPPVTVTATRTVTAATVAPFSMYTLFDRPKKAEFPSPPANDWTRNPVNVGTAPASSRDGWGSTPSFLGEDSLARLEQLPKDTPIEVEGFASYENKDDADTVDWNQELSERRRDALIHLLTTHPRLEFTAVTPGTAHGQGEAKGSTAPAPGASDWWRATATPEPADDTVETITAELTRPPAETGDVDPEPQRPLVPDCFRKIGVRVELIRGTFVRAEVYGEFDVRTAAEARLDEHTSEELPARTNPSDGICTFLVRLRIAEDRANWLASAEFRAIEGDLDGLAKVERSATGSNTALNVLGAVAALSPLLAAATPPSPTAGELVPLVVLGSAAVGLGAAGRIQAQSVILRGGELIVTDGLIDPATGSGPTTTQVSVLLDLETAFSFDLGFIRVDPAKPIVTRYKAVGVRSSWDTRTDGDGTVEYVPLPVFDPSRGYTLDVPAGSLAAAPPLDSLLRVLGVKVSRLNPTYLEVEVGLGVDLGIVEVDTVRVRLRLDADEAPQLTKLGATLDIPGAVHGTGYLEITEFGFKGAFDLTFPSVGLRAAAILALESRAGTTGVLVGAEVEFPVPLPLGNSGLGIFGFLGGVGVNYRRLEPTGVQAPALKWLEAQLTPARGFNVMHPAGWELAGGSFAIAAGVMLGTAEGGFLLHLKGIVLVEVPGPRLLLMMKADVLSLPPVLKSQSSATFLAVLDLDFGRGTITIGIVAEYDVVDLVHIRVPVTAFFDLTESKDWFIDLGRYDDPVTVRVLDVFKGTGYLMIHGDGTTLANPDLPIVTSGLAIAIGFHLQAVLMGSKAVGLYFEVAAGFDALISFEPFAIGGKIYARGELRLWVVGVSAKAELTVLVGRQLENGVEVERTYIHGEVCGKVDLFFFDIEGCIELTIGESEPSPPPAPPLVAGVSLVSRSPALIEGSATDRAVDGKLADALGAGSGEPLPTVPLDAVPVVLFDVPPMVASGDVVLGGVARGESGVGADPWVRRGDRWWRYQVTRIELAGDLQPDPPAGKTPATWWARNAPGQSQLGPALALLSWLPTPTPRAVPYGESLTTSVRERWGHICAEVAPPAFVLWTFDGKPPGPNPPGWLLDGVPWPDPDGAFRTADVRAALDVTEAWRTGDAVADLLQGTDPAIVVGDVVPCPKGRIRLVESVHDWDAGNPLEYGNGALPTSGDALGDVVELMAAGASLADVAATWVDTAWDKELSRTPLRCQGRVLRSPSGDEPEVAPDAPEDERALVKRAWEETGFSPSELANCLRLRCDDGVEALELLLLVSERMLNEGLTIVCRDASGAEVARQPVTGDSMVTSSNPLPAEWTDPDRPWADPIERAGRLAARVVANQRDLLLSRVVVDVPGPVTVVEIGADRSEENLVGTPYWLIAAVGLTSAERYRFDYDSRVVTTERDLLESTVSQDPTDVALLVPSEQYTVRVSWRAESVQQEAKPSATATENWGPEEVQEFRFGADGPDEAPADLGGWLLASAPSMGETGVLCAEPIRIALATQNVTALFDAYGEELRVSVQAASGFHPEPPGGGPAGGALTLPVGVGGVLGALTPALAGVMTPWQQAATELLDELPCTSSGGSRSYGTIVTLPYDLQPLTDYLLDVEAVPKNAPVGATGRRVHRVGFTTSRFATVADLAELIRLAPRELRLVPTPSGLGSLPVAPAGDVLDAAYQAAGLAVPEVPRYPVVHVLWSGDAVPQPVAVVVESSEAMWRSRPMPAVVAGPPDPSAGPGHQWWAAVEADWLSLQPSTAVPAGGDPPRAGITRLVRGPGGTRAVVLLAPGSRGAELRLDLVVAGDALAGSAEQRAEALRIVLDKAPWEVED
ncbi:DUF6603 domain-containing protein [Jiangella mangrovi]|uniref:DUF6603 domain-containing protein n=1 Tax=Jiangella mangrovi TaxID=1524084 RepID=A0A7W9LPF8_9ACTN|nr:DUF6603 domain-containing protein [Jiangella mangrovi]MBB5791234.1 hypothetical protein [Jiangella mangrovi]